MGAFNNQYRNNVNNIVNSGGRRFDGIDVDELISVLPEGFDVNGDNVGEALLNIWNNAQQTKLGSGVGEVLGGMEALETAANFIGDINLDNIGAVIEGAIPGMDNIQGLVTDKLLSFTQISVDIDYDSDGNPLEGSLTTSSASQAVSAILATLTGLSVTDGLLNSVVSVGKTVGLELARGAVSDTIGSATSIGAAVLNSGASASDLTEIGNILSPSTNTGSITSAVTELCSAPANIVEGSLNILENARSQADAVSNNLNTAVENRLNRTDTGLGLSQRVAQDLNPGTTTINENIDVDTSQSALDPIFIIGDNQFDWYIDTPATRKFTYINTAEELISDIRAITRPISGVVVHWTESFSNQNIGSEELNKNKVDVGDDGIQYHYVIRRDGSLQRGRPTPLSSPHTTKESHNTNSLAIAFVGGYNCPTGIENPDKYLSDKSLTQAQFKTFEKFCRAFYLKYPGGQIIGHNDLNKEYYDPGFDVRDYVEDVFNKKSLYQDPSRQEAFDPETINSTRLPT